MIFPIKAFLHEEVGCLGYERAEQQRLRESTKEMTSSAKMFLIDLFICSHVKVWTLIEYLEDLQKELIWKVEYIHRGFG